MPSVGPQAAKPLSSGSTQNFKPHPYQKRAVKKMLENPCIGLFLHPGLGKTSITLMAMRILGDQGFIKGVLVIAPLRAVYNVWPAEIKKWEEFKHLDIGILHDDDKDQVLNEEHDFYAINPEGVMWLVEKLKKIPKERWPFDVLVVDESVKFKDSQTKRFKALRPILNNFKRRYILTGTPTPNGLMDLFGQIYILDQGNALTPFITHYRNKFFIPSGYGGYTWLPQFDAMDRITERVAPLTLTMTREEYLQMPELVQQMVWMELPAAARKIYRDIEKNFITLINNQPITAPSAAAAGVKCRQVLNGALYTGEDKDWVPIHDVKIGALLDLIEELSGQPLLVLYEFIHDKERLVAEFTKRKINFGLLGGQSMKKDQVVIDAFNAGKLPVVLGHPASMGEALNLQGECAHICWFGLTWNFYHYDQAIQRVWRQGNKATHVIAYHLCIKNSLDETVVGTLNSKDRTQEDFTRRVKLLAK